jgi:NAD-dependent SIR2 family protein deacetylase
VLLLRRFCAGVEKQEVVRQRETSQPVPSYCRRKTARKLIVLFGPAATEEEEEEEEEEETECGTFTCRICLLRS